MPEAERHPHDAVFVLQDWTEIIDAIDNIEPGYTPVPAFGRAVAAVATAATDSLERSQKDGRAFPADEFVYRAKGILRALVAVGQDAPDDEAVIDTLYALRGALDAITAEAVRAEGAETKGMDPNGDRVHSGDPTTTSDEESTP